MKLKVFFALIVGATIFGYGLVVGGLKIVSYAEMLADKRTSLKTQFQWDLAEERDVDAGFSLINTSNYSQSFDTVFSLASGDKAPLVVSLHTWSGNYLQPDPLASRIVELGFNYIHPNFQGANNSEDGCLSTKVINDIDSAIDWSIKNGAVDLDAIYVIGASGGGYTALGYAAQGKHQIQHTYAWVPITDLHKWYIQSRNRRNKYADDILGCINSNKLDVDKLADISPINMPPLHSNKISLYAGIEDGYTGPVPISHSIRIL